MTTLADIDSQIAALQKQRTEIEEAEKRAALSGNAKRAIGLLQAMRLAQKEIEDLFPGTFDHERWQSITPQAWPRDNRFKNAADLSETEVANARESGRKAIANIK